MSDVRNLAMLAWDALEVSVSSLGTCYGRFSRRRVPHFGIPDKYGIDRTSSPNFKHIDILSFRLVSLRDVAIREVEVNRRGREAVVAEDLLDRREIHPVGIVFLYSELIRGLQT